MLFTRDTLFQRHKCIENKRMEKKKIHHANSKQKRTVVATLISDEIDFKIKINRNKERYFIMIKGKYNNL